MNAPAGPTADLQRAPPVPRHRTATPEPATPEPATPVPLPRRWFEREAEALAVALLGRYVVRQDAGRLRIGRIVETEAYAGPDDRASHARAGRTRRTEPMFGPAGNAYVYLVYGMHHCLNVVAETAGRPAAVLIRALEPIAGRAAMRDARHTPAVLDARLLAGPALACAGLSIDRGFDGHDLTLGRSLWIGTDPSAPVPQTTIVSGPRVGVTFAGPGWADRPWRFGLADSTSLSRPFPTPARTTHPAG